MRIEDAKQVWRFLVKFTKEETAGLNMVGFSFLEEEGEMWIAVEEFSQLYYIPCFKHEDLDRILYEAMQKTRLS